MFPKKVLPFLLLMTVCFAVTAQQNSPYSRFGLGTMLPSGFANSQAMGSFSSALFSPFNLNYNNPATYASLFTTTYEVGAYANYLSIQEGDLKTKTGNANLSYLAMGFPLPNKKRHHRAGLSFGLIPMSRVHYDIESEFNHNDTMIGQVNTKAEGQGTLYRAYIGGAYAYRLEKSFEKDGEELKKVRQISFGTNLGYVLSLIHI